jgi:hypothetical protein
MKFLPLGWGFAIALMGAIAFTPTQPVTSHIIKVSQQPLPTQPYTTDFFSLDLPVGWTAQTSGPEYYIFWNDPPVEAGGGIAPVHVIKTDITPIDGDFETIVEQNYFLENEGEEIVTYRQVQINGRDAVQFHTQGGGWDFPDTFVTIVRYSDQQSLLMASYFTNSQASSLPTIERLHQSLTVKISP